MNRTLGLILAIILALCLLAGIVGGTYSYLSDTETSNDNHMKAGTLDFVSLVYGSYSGNSSMAIYREHSAYQLHVPSMRMVLQSPNH
jgi:predicted ribosomally synthesized peptide with SipW-like signal peptide